MQRPCPCRFMERLASLTRWSEMRLRGISKINVNTELRSAYLEATQAQMLESLSGRQVAALHRAQVAAVERVVENKLQVYDLGVELSKRAVPA